jgi:hypothetical protein
MKIRNGFISNSSSTSFIIINKTNKPLTLVDFVWDNRNLVEKFNEKYNTWILLGNCINDAEEVGKIFPPKEQIYMVFGDEQRTELGRVYDYILRDGGNTDKWEWWQEGSLR